MAVGVLIYALVLTYNLMKDTVVVEWLNKVPVEGLLLMSN
jgi:hypothetical protein